MRQFSGAATLLKDERGRLRLILSSPTGEEVFHDLSPGEADAMRATLGPAEGGPKVKGQKAKAR